MFYGCYHFVNKENYNGSKIGKISGSSDLCIFVLIYVTNIFRIHSNNTVQDFLVVRSRYVKESHWEECLEKTAVIQEWKLVYFNLWKI